MKRQIKVAFASGPDHLNRELVERMRNLFPELPLYVVSEFPPHHGRWIPYHVWRGFWENLARCRSACNGKRVRLAGVLLVPRMPYRRMRLIALVLAPIGFLAFNEHFGSFMLRPRCAGTILRHLAWRAKNWLRWQLNPGGGVYTFVWKLERPREWRIPLLYAGVRLSGWAAVLLKALLPTRAIQPEQAALPGGVSVVIPSRDGRDLLAQALPAVLRELEGIPSEVIVVDNGSADGTSGWLESHHPAVVLEVESRPLSFARAVNRGIARARYSHVCLLNNDMQVAPGFFRALRAAFDAVPDLFCATAQIFFPDGVRREETGKAVFAGPPGEFPIRCELPIPGEDLSCVLYGSGGCSLYSAGKLRALGGLSEAYQPAYCEDLDLGYRAWLAVWPTVFVAGARVEHGHRSTTSRYYSPEQLDAFLQVNYLRFLRRAVASARVLAELWRDAARRLRPRLPALSAPLEVSRPVAPVFSERRLLALASGDVAVFPGRARRSNPVVLIASPYAPFPLAHGGAVRMYNLMRRAARDFDHVPVCFAPALETPPDELLEICTEIVLVRLRGSHSRPSTPRPDVVEEFDSPAFHAALHQTARKWRPAIAQLEFTQMAQYAAVCRPARTVLVEHDVTFDLYQQLLALNDDWDLRRQLGRWRRFESAAWREVDCVVTMSERDRRMVSGARAVVLPNGVDLERFHPAAAQAEPRRLLFIGSFAHLPNLLALDFFLREVRPRLDATLHVIAGARHQYFLDFYRDRVRIDLEAPGIELEGFVADVRPAYQRATLVVAPLVASAGTNIKVLEAMAMGKAIVSTPAGVNGLDLVDGRDVALARTGEEMAAAINALLADTARRRALETSARATAEQLFDWERIAQEQVSLYRSLISAT